MGEYKPAEYYDGFEVYPPEVFRPPWCIKGTRRPPGGPWLQRFDAICRHIRPNDRILDLGCGNGLLAAYLHYARSGAYGQYVGLDYSTRRIEAARQGAGHHRDVEYHLRDIIADDLTDFYEDCNVIICAEVLEHLKDDLGFIKSWPKGKFCVITVPTFDCPSHLRWFTPETALQRYEPLLTGVSVTTFPPRRPRRRFRGWIVFTGVT